MCGIAGKLSFYNNPDDFSLVKTMCETMLHRGPDFRGVKKLDNCTLGHSRLSIIDLSESANQPMCSEDGRYHITFNGEIYNFNELKADLLKKNIRFTTSSDTEVLLNLFILHGHKCVEKLNGMFAFAVWDKEKKQLFLARDRFGKKPLYYYIGKGNFYFASDLRALATAPELPKKTSLPALNCYLALGYILNPLTVYEDIFLLEPSSYMYVDDFGDKISKGFYYDYSASFKTKTTEKEPEIAANVLSLLRASVKRRMICDVPVGAFLSGGLDSTSIVALMKEFHKGALHTFSVGFNQKSYNELGDADRAANYIGTTHHGFMCEPDENLSMLHNAINAFDQPFADTSLIPMVEVSDLASKHVTVVLSGDGSDEIFAGYITCNADRYYEYARKAPAFIKKMLSKLPVNTAKKIGWRYKTRQFFYGTMHDYRQAHYLWRIMFHPEERVSILGQENREMIMDTDPFKSFEKYYNKVSDLPRGEQHLYVDAMTWLTDDILVKLDRSSMHSSIEARTPFLDVDLVDYVASIPYSMKLNGSNGKYILKHAMKNILPDFVLQKKKSGFNAPVNSWIKMTESDEFKNFNKYVFDNKMKLYEAK